MTVTGKVNKFADISPPRVVLNGEVGEDLKVTIKVSPASEGLFEIIRARADHGKDMRVTLADKAGTTMGVYTLLVENTRTAPGRYQDVVRLYTTSKVNKEILIPVWGNITPPQVVTVRPRHLALTGRAGSPLKGTVSIVARDNTPFSITSAKARSGAYITLDLKETAESGNTAYTLTVENTKKDEGRYFDSIVLRTDRADLPEIRINVSGRITE